MQREGSAFNGVLTVAAKEMADQLSSARIVILQLLIALIGGTMGQTNHLQLLHQAIAIGSDAAQSCE